VDALGPRVFWLTSFNDVEELFISSRYRSNSLRVLARCAARHPRFRLVMALRRGIRDLRGVGGSIVDSNARIMRIAKTNNSFRTRIRNCEHAVKIRPSRLEVPTTGNSQIDDSNLVGNVGLLRQL
jgi:hypothetical protein